MKALVVWFPLVRSSGDVFDISAREITICKRIMSDIRVKTWFYVVSVVFSIGHRTATTEAADVNCSVLDSSSDFLVPGFDVPIFEDKIFEEESKRYLGDLTFKDDRGRSGLQWILNLCRTNGLPVPSNVQSV